MKNMNPEKYKSPSRGGFTLVEVLVSSFLTLIIMGMLFSVLVGTMNAWEGGTSRLKSAGDARLALDILKTDLESLVARQTQYNQEWILSEPYEVEGIQNTRLLFFAPSLDRKVDDSGDIVALSYKVAFQDPISPSSNVEPIFGLYKGMTDTVVAFNNVLGNTDLDVFWSDSSTSYSFSWNETSTPVELALDNRGFLAPNVVQFNITWLIRNATTDNIDRYGPENTIKLSNQLIAENESTGWGPFTVGKIEAADVSITSISDEGMRRYAFLNGSGSITAAQSNAIIKEFGRTHTMRVPISY